MQTVKEFKQLLQLNLDTIKLNDDSVNCLEAANKQSAKLTQMLAQHIEPDGSLFEMEQSTIYHDATEVDSKQKSNIDNMKVNPGIDGENIKTFEELINHKLQDNKLHTDASKHHTNTLSSKKKMPFLKKGEGIKRFSKGENSILSNLQIRTTATTKPNKASINQEVVKETVLTKPLRVARQKLPENSIYQTVRQLQLRSDLPQFAKKVMHIEPKVSTRTVNKAQYTESNSKQNRNLEQTNTECMKKLEELLSMLSTQTNGKHSEQISNKSVPPTDLATNETYLIRQIDQLEKRLVYLMDFKRSLIVEGEPKQKHENCDNVVDYGLVSSLDNIKKEISKLNDRLSSISTATVVPQQPLNSIHNDNQSDAKSRHSVKPELTTGTLSHTGYDKISNNQSKTYVYQNGTTETIHQNGLKVLNFPTGQTERIQPDGTKEVIYPDGQRRLYMPGHSEQLYLRDGRVYTIFADGTEQIDYQNGDVEYKTAYYTKRHFHNGHTKTVFSNGYQETVYNNGRVRVKDHLGNLLFDRVP